MTARVPIRELGRRAPERECPCPICASGRAVRALEDAHEAWLEQAADVEMNYAWLRDEIEGALAMRWWQRPRRRLRAALKMVHR